MPPFPSPIDRIAQSIIAELCVAKGQYVGFVENDWLEQRIARLIRDTTLTTMERCAEAVEALPAGAYDADAFIDGRYIACRAMQTRAVYAIRNLPLAGPEKATR